MISRLLALPERYPGRTIAAIGLIFAMAYASGVMILRKPDGRIIVGDAVHYYVYVRSAVFDRDLQFRNDYIQMYGLRRIKPAADWLNTPTATGHVRNMMSVGPAIAWTPGFLIATVGVAVARAFGSEYPLDGFGRLFQVTAGFSGILAATFGAWLTFRLCARYFSRRAAIWSTLAVWLGSNALYYSVVSPTYSHAISMLVISGFFLYWARTRDKQTGRRYAIVGALGGLVALVRWQDAVFLIVPLVDVLASAMSSSSSGRWRRAILHLAICGAAALVAFLPQIMVFMILYGQPVAMPQGSEWMQWGSPHFRDVLFSTNHGLISWTPVCGLGLIGLVPLFRRDRVLGAACLAAFAVSLYANAAVLEWWAGEAFGLRRFVSCFPIFALGMAALLDRFDRHQAVAFAAITAILMLNFLLLLHYQAFMHGVRSNLPYPEGAFLSPLDLLRWVRSL